MTGKLNAIPIAVVHAPQATGLPGNALAILHELEGMLGALAERRETHSIDLRRLSHLLPPFTYLCTY